MDMVSIRFQEDVLKRMDKCIDEHNFNSRTEFIREAVRDKLTELSRDELLSEFLKFRGRAKKKTSYKENLATKETVSKEFLTELEKRFS